MPLSPSAPSDPAMMKQYSPMGIPHPLLLNTVPRLMFTLPGDPGVPEFSAATATPVAKLPVLVPSAIPANVLIDWLGLLIAVCAERLQNPGFPPMLSFRNKMTYPGTTPVEPDAPLTLKLSVTLLDPLAPGIREVMVKGPGPEHAVVVSNWHDAVHPSVPTEYPCE